MQLVQGVFKTGNDSNHRTVPKRSSRSILPVCAGWIQNRFVPVESFLDAAIRLRLRRSSGCEILQFRGHDMLRVPELPRAAVCNSSERAATRRAPVRPEDRFPHHKHAYLSAGLPCQQLLSCGGPPQTSRSSRRQQQDQAWNVGVGIERFLELSEICLGKRKNGLLPVWRRSGTP